MDKNLTATIDKLSQLESFEALYHHKNTDAVLPSIDELNKIVLLARKILFPGYFGNSTIHSDNVYYYIGVQIEKLKNSLNKLNQF